MKEIVKKLNDIEMEIAIEKGEFILFAFILPEEAAGYWDLLISAKWADKNRKTSLEYFIKKLKEKLSDNELVKISRILFIDSNNFEEGLSQIRGGWEEGEMEFYGVSVKKAYMIVAPIQTLHFERVA